MPLDLTPILDLTPLDEGESIPPERGDYILPPPPVPRRPVAPFEMAEFSRGTPENPFGVATPAERTFTAAQPSEFDRPVIPPGVFKTALDIGTMTMPRTELMEGFKEGTAEQLAGMTSQKSLAMTPAFAVPYAGPLLAAGLGAEAVGSGAGTTVAALESGDTRQIGVGLSQVAGGGAMIAGGGIAARPRPAIPPRIVEAIAKADAVGLTKSAQAVADVVREPFTPIQEPATFRNGKRIEPDQLQTGAQEKPGVGREAAPNDAAAITRGNTEAANAWLEAVARGDKQAATNIETALLRTEAGNQKLKELELLVGLHPERAEVRTSGDYGIPVREAAATLRARSPQGRESSQQQPGQPATGESVGAPQAAQAPAVGETARTVREVPNPEQAARSAGEVREMLPSRPSAETKVEPARLLTPVEKFTADVESGAVKTTQAAHEFGRSLTTPEQIVALKQAHEQARERGRAALKSLRENPTAAQAAEAIALSQKPQYFNEAIDAATGADKVKLTDAAKFQELREAGKPINEKAKDQTESGLGSAGEQAARDISGLPKERLRSVQSGAAPEAVPVRPAGEEPVGRPAVAGAEVPSQTSGTPPVKPPATPPATPSAPTPPPGSPRASLDDVYRIFEPAPKEREAIGPRVSRGVEQFRTGVSSSFRPLNKLAEDVAQQYGGTPKDVAGIFEQLKGSSGKAEADVYRFDQEVSNAVKGSEKDFNAYMFLRRSLDRLNQDAADIARAQAGENVPKLNRRKVSQYTIPELEAKLATLSEQIGGEKLAGFSKAADAYQTHMDQALRLQVESGRMSPEVYGAIKEGNQFYAPFKVLKYIEESSRPEGAGRKVDTTADYVKAMEGIEDPNFKLGDMLAAARYNLNLSRTLAEKNRAMQNISELAALDTEGLLVQKLKPGQEPIRGMEAVTVLENGQPQRYQVNNDVATALHNIGGAGGPLVARMAGGLFRAGATTLNLPFQVSNLMADVPRQALVSKYGLRGATDLVAYPLDFIQSMYSSIAGDVFGVKNKLFLDFLDSGAAGATVQQYLTPDSLRYNPATLAAKSKSLGKTLLDTIPQFANAIEQTSKVVGVKRALRETGKKSGAELAREIPEAITEIRRFSGSPDFGRMGKWVDTYRLNLLYMFLNARIQGAVADVGRLTGRDGAPTAVKTWAKVGTAIGIPSVYLYLLNNSDEYREDYAQRPEQEKRNYWLIPKDTFITGSNGERMRDYWRVPKREIAQWVANATESGMDFARQREPEAFWKWAGGMAESLSPVNIQGDTAQERLESIGASLNPLVKAPLETATGRDLYRHRPIVPDAQRQASPELQFTDRTAEIFKTLADKMPDVAPEVFRSPLMLENLTKNFTAGLITQFLPRKPVEGRTAAENQPLLQRFQALPYTDSSEFENRIQRFERESADEQLQRLRDAKAIMDANGGAQPEVLIEKMIEKHGQDVKLAGRIVDLYVSEQRGITSQERRVLALPVTQRAEYLADELRGKTPEQKASLLRNWALKRVLTERVAAELAPRLEP